MSSPKLAASKVSHDRQEALIPFNASYAVMGNPIHHSKSPLIHHQFAKQTHQALTYQALLVPLGGLEQALNQFGLQGGHGLNITTPFKQEALSLVNNLSERAHRAQAVNTILFKKDGTLWGDNTDGIGLIRDILFNQCFSIQNKHVLILGAGGAVRGILEPLLKEKPAKVVIANRTEHKAAALMDAFSDLGQIEVCPWSELKNHQFDLVINGTSASLQKESLSLPGGILLKNSCCYDMVYGKGKTSFLRWAEEQRSFLCCDGLGMLVEQAAESFYMWRGLRPETQPVLTSLLTPLK